MKVKIELNYDNENHHMKVRNVFITFTEGGKYVATMLMENMDHIGDVVAWANEHNAELEITTREKASE